VTKVNHSDINKSALDVIKKEKMVKKGDLVIITKGDYVGVVGGSNAMKILSI
jgi:pyruvate kinase